MPHAIAPEPLSPFDAFLRFTEPALIKAIREQERQVGASRLLRFYREHGSWRRLIPLEEAGKSAPPLFDDRGPVLVPQVPTAGAPGLLDAWTEAERAFRRWLAHSASITGVQTQPELSRDRAPIPAAWAPDAVIDFSISTLTVGQTRFSAVLVSEAAQPAALEHISAVIGSGVSAVTPRPVITRDNVHTLSAEELVLVWTELLQRVVREGMKLPPGPVTPMPILVHRMQELARAGELLPKVSAQGRELGRWARVYVPDHYVPTDEQIENAIREEYRRLKAADTGRNSSSDS